MPKNIIKEIEFKQREEKLKQIYGQIEEYHITDKNVNFSPASSTDLTFLELFVFI